jgi:hypothetical protein
MDLIQEEMGFLGENIQDLHVRRFAEANVDTLWRFTTFCRRQNVGATSPQGGQSPVNRYAK